MNTMKWLIKREFWEHKGGFFWTPIVVGMLMILFVVISLAIVVFGRSGSAFINGVPVTSLAVQMADADRIQVVGRITEWYMGTSSPLFFVLGFVVFFFCLGTLFDERKDRSILFWKSLPVSDSATIFSKVLLALGIAPLITVACAAIMSVIILLLSCAAMAMKGSNFFADILGSTAFYAAPFKWAAMWPIYVLWALPTVGWLIMVGAWARSKPFSWAVGVPLLAGGLISWVNMMFELGIETSWVWTQIIARLLLSAFPGYWFKSPYFATNNDTGLGQYQTASDMVSQSWQLLGTANLWFGVIAGAAMIYAAIYIRRSKDES